MSKSYIELTSGFRNRLLYPNTADFVVNPCENEAENHLENSNNISAAYPFYNFWALPLNIIKRWDCTPKQQTELVVKLNAADAGDPPFASLVQTWTTHDCCQPVIITDAYGSSGIIIGTPVIDTDPDPPTATITVLIGCEDTHLKADVTPNSATISGGDPANPPNPSTGSIESAKPPSITSSDTGNYKPELLPINYGVDACNSHLTTQYINNPSVGLTATHDLQNKLAGCCVGTAGKPIFSNQILPVHTLPNMYNWKIEIDSCTEITSIYNSYASTGLIHSITGQCCMSRYFDGMVMTNFANGQDCTECSTIIISRDTATLPSNRCCDIIIPVRQWDEKHCGVDPDVSYPQDGLKISPCTAFSTYFSINAANQSPRITANSVGCVTACPVTDSVSFDMSPSFTNSFKCIDWFGKDNCWDQIKCEKAQYNPYIVNNQSWNCVRVQGGGPTDANNAYCCSFMEMIPAPINAYKNFSHSLPGGLSDRFKVVSSYDAVSKLAAFNAYDCCDSLVQRQWQRMIYWMLYARCGRDDSEPPQSIYNPDELCNTEILNKLATGSTSSLWPVDSRVEGCPDSAIQPAEQIIKMAASPLPATATVNKFVCVPESDLKVGGTLTQGVVTFRIVELGVPAPPALGGVRALTPSEGGPSGPPIQKPNLGTYAPSQGLWITVVPTKSECSYEPGDFIQGGGGNPSPIDTIINVNVNGVLTDISTVLIPSPASTYGVTPDAAAAAKASNTKQAMGAIRTYTVSGHIGVQNGYIVPSIGIPVSGGCGCGASFNIESNVTCEIDISNHDVSINNHGKNYKIGDKLQILPSAITVKPNILQGPLQTINAGTSSTLTSINGSILPQGITPVATGALVSIVGINACGDSCQASFEIDPFLAVRAAGATMITLPAVTLASTSYNWDSTAINGPQIWSESGGGFVGVWTSAELQQVMTATLIINPLTNPPPIIEGPGIIITVSSVTPTVFWPDIGLASKGANYIWNYRMRQQMPELIATANTGTIQNTLTYTDVPQIPTTSYTSTIDYAVTTPPLFLFGVPYSVDVLTGGSGYRHGGYFIYGVNNCDLFEITFGVNCGEVCDAQLTKLALDQTIYDKLLGGTVAPIFPDQTLPTPPFAQYKATTCDIGKQAHYFNAMIPDIIELNEQHVQGTGQNQYTYNWNGQSDATRVQDTWFGGSGACIRINKGYGFFSNLGHTEKTNYAHKTMNTPYGPGNNDQTGCLLFLPSVAEACNNNLGELRNSLNFSTFYQTNKQYNGSFNTVNSSTCPAVPSVTNNYNLKYQVNSQMKYMQQYPKVMSKEVGCQYNYAEPPFNSDSTGTTPILANYSTQDIQIFWNRTVDATDVANPVASNEIPAWTECRFQYIEGNTQTLTAGTVPNPNIKVIRQLVQCSVLITRNAFPGFPLNIDGLWDIPAATTETNGSLVGWDSGSLPAPTGTAATKALPKQCCAYEWEVLPISAPSIRPINNQLIPKSSTHEQSCWRINLRNLLVPNSTLQSGSLASFYPYFYVEFTNVTDVQRQHQMIQSNNPNAKPALFRCAVTDIATPLISKFIKLTGDGMYQTVKFRPNDSLKLKIYLPDGREFMTTQPDNAPPSPVNPLLQISALFEIEHI